MAIIGVACHLPGGVRSLSDLAEFLFDRGCAITEIPEDRWSAEKFHDTSTRMLGLAHSARGGFLHDVWGFDPEPFGLSPAETTQIDPQQRLVLQTALEALDDTGRPPQCYSEANTGVFVGVSTNDFAGLSRMDSRATDTWAGTGFTASIVANRVSHRLDLSGPSYAVDTACSSALVALDQARRNLITGACDVALAGGVNCLLEPTPFISFSNANMLSRSGQIYAFDARADGFVRAEGCAMVVLKRYEDALSDGDNIYAVIDNTAVNQDGYTTTLTAPNPAAQEAVLSELLRGAGVNPSEIGYVEAHGTGTQVGDPIEVAAIAATMRSAERSDPLPVGSLKPNLGHLEAAAGITGLLKAIVAITRQAVPPNIFFDEPNPRIPFDALNVRVPKDAVPLTDPNLPRRIVVNSFGFGGTNASVLLSPSAQKPLKKTANGYSSDPAVPIVVPVAGRSESQRDAKLLDVAGQIEAAPQDLERFASELQSRRNFGNWRSAAVLPAGADRQTGLSLKSAVESRANGKAGKIRLWHGTARGGRKVVFTFSGQGSQWWGMARQLLEQDDGFRSRVADLDARLRRHVDWSLAESLLADRDDSPINDGAVSIAAIVGVQVSLARLWMDRGIEPDMVVGHSLGELSAAHIAGVVDLDDLALLIHQRAQIRKRTSEQGRMAVVGIAASDLQDCLNRQDGVSLAAVNSPTISTLTGPANELKHCLAELRAAHPRAMIRTVNTDFAWHSALLDPGGEQFRSAIEGVRPGRPKTCFISTLDGQIPEQIGPDYWWRNLRQPVNYPAAIEHAVGRGADTFIEISPAVTLTPLTLEIAQAGGQKVVAVPSLRRGRKDFEALADATAQLWVAGIDVLDPVDRIVSHTPDSAPRTPQYGSYRQLPVEAEHALNGRRSHPLLGNRELDPDPVWTSDLDLHVADYLGGHRIGRRCIMPAAGFVDMMAAAAKEALDAPVVELAGVRLLDPLILEDGQRVLVRTRMDRKSAVVRIQSRLRYEEADWAVHAEARATAIAEPEANGADTRRMTEPPNRGTVDSDAFYRLAKSYGYAYEGPFRGIELCWSPEDRVAHGWICWRGEPDVQRRLWDHAAHPALLDSALQSAILIDALRSGGTVEQISEQAVPLPTRASRLPEKVDRVRIYDSLPEEAWVEFRATDANTGDYRITDTSGRLLVEVSGFRSRAPDGGSRETKSDADMPPLYREAVSVGFEPSAETHQPTGLWCIFSDSDKAFPRQLERHLVGAGCTTNWSQSLETAVQPDTLLPDGSDPIHCAVVLPAPGLSGAPDIGAIASVSQNLVSLAAALDARCSELEKPASLLVATIEAGPDKSGSAFAALCRTIANECVNLVVNHVTIPTGATLSDAELAKLLAADGRDLNFGGDGLAATEIRQTAPFELTRRSRPLRNGENAVVGLSSPGALSNLIIEAAPPATAGPGEAVVETAAVGLNFRDIMATTGLLPDERDDESAWWRNLGLEFAGTVRETGDKVTNVSPGDRVFGMGRGLLRRFATVDSQSLFPVPDTLSLPEAATVPVAFMTAVYGLEVLGRLAAGERVLIHLASGGVGLAAIQVARRIGAEVYATAGTEEKRAYLRSLGLRHVMDSRTLAFRDQVLEATGGRGVDVILNSLSGEGIDRSLDCLAPYGRFIELGKRDPVADKPIGLSRLADNKSYAVVDFSTFAEQQPLVFFNLMNSIIDRFNEGSCQALPSHQFPMAQADQAFALFGRGKHIGKVAIGFETENQTSVVDRHGIGLDFSNGGSVLITGGTRGLGLALAEHIARRGPQGLILCSRSGTVPDEDEDGFQRIASQVPVRCEPLDVCDSEAVIRLTARLAGEGVRIAGVIHAAAVIDDGFIGQMTPQRFSDVIAPKILGAMNLDIALTESGQTADFFVLLSSIAEVIGSIGQANYVIANAMISDYARWRSATGHPTHCLQLGVVAGTGFVHRSRALADYLASTGLEPVTPADVFSAIEATIRTEEPVLLAARANWTKLGRALPRTVGNGRFAKLTDQGSVEDGDLRSRLAAAAPEEHLMIATDAVAGEVAALLKIDVPRVSRDTNLVEFGLDSLSAFELIIRLETLAQVPLRSQSIMRDPTVDAIGGLLLRALETSGEKADETDQELLGESAVVPDVEVARPEQRASDQLDLYRSRLTTDGARSAMILTGGFALENPVGRSEWASRLCELMGAFPELRLTADGLMHPAEEVAATVLLPLDTDAIADHAPSAAPLWSVTSARLAHGEGFRFQIKAHRAAVSEKRFGDILQALRGAFSPTFRPPAKAATDPGLPRRLTRDEAYWRTVLGRFPVPPAGRYRRLAPMPRSIGLYQGRVCRWKRRIPIVPGSTVEALLFAAWVRSISRWTGQDGVIIEYFPDKGAANRGASPVEGWSFPAPVEKGAARLSGDGASRALAAAQGHAAYDFHYIDRYLGPTLPELAAHWHTYGFHWGDSDQTGTSGAPAPWNDVRVDAQIKEQMLEIVVTIDIDAIGQRNATRLRRLFSETLAELGAAKGKPATNRWVPVKDVDAPAEEPQTTAPASIPQVPGTGLSAQQAFLIAALRDDAASTHFKSFWTISRGFVVRPSLDRARFHAAAERIHQRHQSLRQVVTEATPGHYRMIIDPVPCPIHFLDADGRTRQAVLDSLSRSIDPFREPLYRIEVVALQDGLDLVHCVGHHLAMDGWSINLLIEEMFRAYVGLPIGTDPIPVADYLARYDRSHDQAVLKRRDDYFAALMADPPPVPNLGGPAILDRRTAETGPVCELTFQLGTDAEARLNRVAADSEATVAALLVAALADCLASRSGRPDIVVCVTDARRHVAELSNYVGWVAASVPVRCRTSESHDLSWIARDISSQISVARAFPPTDFANHSGPLLNKVQADGGYLALFEAGMLTTSSALVGDSTSGLSIAGGSGMVSFGSVEFQPIPEANVRHGGAFAIDLKSYETENGTALRFGFDSDRLSNELAQSLFDGVLKRLALIPDK